MHIPPSIAVIVARLRMPSLVLGVLVVATSPLHDSAWLSWAGAALVVASIVSTFMGGIELRRDPIAVATPVRGRWIAVNSPADKVPSHGVHSAGQTYALDLVHWPDANEAWKPVHAWPLMRRPEDFPGFGEPVFSPADGRVVRSRDWWRDHWSRNSWPALLFAFVEGSARELLGPGALLGNHVVLDLGSGAYAALAHLKRGSLTVSPGQTVRAGQWLAECGNSGNTSEPHLHFQLMDTSRPSVAAGLPFTFVGHDVPRNEQPLMERQDGPSCSYVRATGAEAEDT
jgi:hypothetical protein